MSEPGGHARRPSTASIPGLPPRHLINTSAPNRRDTPSATGSRMEIDLTLDSDDDDGDYASLFGGPSVVESNGDYVSEPTNARPQVIPVVKEEEDSLFVTDLGNFSTNRDQVINLIDEDDDVSAARLIRVDYTIDLTDVKEETSSVVNMNTLPAQSRGRTPAPSSVASLPRLPVVGPARWPTLAPKTNPRSTPKPPSRPTSTLSPFTKPTSQRAPPKQNPWDANTDFSRGASIVPNASSSRQSDVRSNGFTNTSRGGRINRSNASEVGSAAGSVAGSVASNTRRMFTGVARSDMGPPARSRTQMNAINESRSEGSRQATLQAPIRKRPRQEPAPSTSTTNVPSSAASQVSVQSELPGRPSKRSHQEATQQTGQQRSDAEVDRVERALHAALAREAQEENIAAEGDAEEHEEQGDIQEYALLQSRRDFLRDKRSISGKLSKADQMELAQTKVQILALEMKIGLDADDGSDDDSDGAHGRSLRPQNRRANCAEIHKGNSSSPEPENADDRSYTNGQASTSNRALCEQLTQPTTASGRRKPVQNAGEYWKRRWDEWIVEEDKKAARAGGDDSDAEEAVHRAPDLVSDRRIALQRTRMGADKEKSGGGGGWWNKKRGKDQLLRVLYDENPVMARAAVDSLPLPGPIRATNRKNAINEMMFKIRADRANRDGGDGGVDEETVQEETDKMILAEAVKSFGYKKCVPKDGYWHIRKYKFKPQLYNLQVVGISWMLRQEYSPSGPFGGILADEMGLGKTIELLGVMSVNRPGEDDAQPTLIVLPSAAILQWKAEIAKFTNFTKVLIYKASRETNINIMKDCQIILASYNEVAKAYPSEEAIEQISGQQLPDEEWVEALDREIGDLLKIDYFRVILDEAHAIKNSRSRTSKACLVLRSKYRWAASGTPIQNTLDELYPYFKFIGAQWSSSLQEFKGKLGDLENAGVRERLLYTLSTLMLRRRVSEKFMGRNNLEIPMTHPVEDVWIDLSVEEKIIYKRLEARFIDNINQDIANMSSRYGVDGPVAAANRLESKQRKKKKKMRTYFAFLTRLRQVVGHPFLLESAFGVNFNLEDLHYLRNQLRLYGGERPVHLQLREMILPFRTRVVMEYEIDDNGQYPDPDDRDQARRGYGGVAFGKGNFGYTFDMDKQLRQMQESKTMWDTQCRACKEDPIEPQITECGHVICHDCLEPLIQIAALDDEDWVCPECQTVVPRFEPLTIPDGVDSDDEEPRRAKSKGKGKARAGSVVSNALEEPAEVAVDRFGTKMGDDFQNGQPRLIDRSRWIKAYDVDPDTEGGLVPSAKLVALKNQVLKWQRQAPDDKIIIFIEWMKLGALIGRVLQQEGIGFVYFWGELKNKKKYDAIHIFESEPSVKVMITSIKCGSQALNLTCANRVISMDLWWNTAVESQAFGRVHRVGQTKETYFCRILAHGTIDQRLYDMQRHKAAQVETTLGDKAGGEKLKLTFEEIRELLVGGARPGQQEEVDKESDTAKEEDVFDVDELMDEGDDEGVEVEEENEEGERDERWKAVGGYDNEELNLGGKGVVEGEEEEMARVLQIAIADEEGVAPEDSISQIGGVQRRGEETAAGEEMVVDGGEGVRREIWEVEEE